MTPTLTHKTFSANRNYYLNMAILKVKVKPNSQQQSIEAKANGSLKVCLKSPPVDGKANQELIKLLAKKFNVKKSEITIKSGLSSKNKLIEISLPET